LFASPDNAGLDNKAAFVTVQALTGESIGYLSDMGVSAKLQQLSLWIENSDTATSMLSDCVASL